MFWISQFTLLLLASALALQTDSFSFDASPMTIRECGARPVNKCGPTMLHESDCWYLQGTRRRSAVPMETLNDAQKISFEEETYYRAPVVTFIKLRCNYQRNSNATKQDLLKQSLAIRKKSKTRAVKIELLDSVLFGNDTIGPISDQIVSLTLIKCADPRITSQLSNLVNMLQFTLTDCQTPITVHKSDFSPLQKIRIIIFDNSPIGDLELGTFTNLPDPMTFALERNHLFTDNAVFLSARNRLHCDSRNDWIWKWLKQHTDLEKNRIAGEVYKIGSMENEFLNDFATKRMACNPNGTIARSRARV